MNPRKTLVIRTSRWRAAILFATSIGLLGGCAAGGGAAPAGEPLPDPSGAAAELVELTTPLERRQITFQWTLDESGSRVRGRGVVRLEPPDRLRLDLFGPRNETVLAAALVGGEARLPAGAPDNAPIPSPALLWAGLGVIHPPVGAVLRSVEAVGDDLVLRYAGADEERFEYTVTPAPESRLKQLQRIGPHGPLETVQLTWSAEGAVARASYRDWAAYRELTLDVQEIVAAEPFSPSIWTP